MTIKHRIFFLTLVTILTLLVNLAFPMTAFADDETPPPAPTEEPAAPPTEETAPLEEQPTVEEVLDQLPEDTPVVVFNEEGETVPLVSEEAAEIIEEGDPMWCPGLYGQPGAVLPGGVGCTPLRTNFTGAAATGLVNYINNNEPTYSGAGTIYVTNALGAADAAASQINLFAGVLDTLTDLTIQGGWNGLSSGSFALSGQTDFGDTRLQIGTAALQWNGSVTLNDLSFSGVSSGNGITVYTNSGDITLNNVDVQQQAGNFSTALLNSASGDITVQNGSTFDGDALAENKGFYAETTTGTITITDTTFSDTTNSTENRNGATLTGTTVDLENITATNNDYNGIKVNATSDVTLGDVSASGNGADGVKIDADGNVTVEDGVFHDNGFNGINIAAGGYVELNNNESYENSWNGANVDSTGNITVDGGSYYENVRRGILGNSDGDMVIQGGAEFNDNTLAGIYIDYVDNLFIYDDVVAGGSIFSGNDGRGLYADAVYGDVYIEDASFELNGLRGLYLSSVLGEIEIVDSEFNENTNGGAYLGAAGDITIDSSNFTENQGTGLEAYSAGEINLNDVNANNNDNDGAFLDTTYGTGDIIMTGTNSFDDNDHSGLYAYSGSNITLNNVSADGNDYDGAYLDACGCGGGDITLTGTNTFNNNDGVGLQAYSVGNITLHNVTATYNYYNGAWLDNTGGTGDVSIYDSFFDDNVFDGDYAGLNVDSNGFVTLSNVSASNNGGDGANIGYSSGSWTGVLVENSIFNNNSDGIDDEWGYGLYIDNGDGDATLNNVIASGNQYDGLYVTTTGNVSIDPSEFSYNGDNGVYLEIGGNAYICDTTFNNNDIGVDAANVAGSLTMGNVTFSGNNTDYVYGGSNLMFDCNPVDDDNKDSKGSSVVIPVTGGEQITCDGTATSTTVKLPNGDEVTLPCPINDFAVVAAIVESELPNPLGDGNRFLSALTANVMRGNQPVQNLEDPMTVSFVIPEGLKSDVLAILFWDGTQWVELDGQLSEDGLHFEVLTELAGTFVLVGK